MIALVPALLPGPLLAQGEFPGIARAHQDVELGFTVEGRVAEVLAREGQRVDAGTPLVRLDSRDAREQLGLLRARAESTIEIDAAQASLDLAENEESRVREALRADGASDFEVRRAELATTQARLTLALREREHAESRAALRRAEIALEQFTCSSTIAGVVEVVRVDDGELVDRLVPVVRVVNTERLRVEVAVPTERTLGLGPGDPVQVFATVGEARFELRGEIDRLASIADSASETRMMTITAGNPDGLPAGVRVLVLFDEN